MLSHFDPKRKNSWKGYVAVDEAGNEVNPKEYEV
jgi:hypothetical protein